MNQLKESVKITAIVIFIAVLVMMMVFSHEALSYKQYCISLGYSHATVKFDPEKIYSVFCVRTEYVTIEELEGE